MTTDPTPDGVAGTHADATGHLVPRAVRPIDIEHDQLMARAAAEHQARVTADQARATDDRATVLLWAADEIDRKDAEQGFPEDGVGWATNELRRLAAGERDEQQTQQGECPHGCDTSICPCLACEAAEEQQSDTETLPSIHANDVQGFCPACGHGVLMLGEGGHVVCTLMDCPKPEAADELLHQGAAPVAVQPPADTGEEARPAVVAEPGEETGPAIPCSWAATRYQHSPHDWTPQPSMDPVHCPGHSFTEEA